MKKSLVSLSILFFICFVGSSVVFAADPPDLAGSTWTGSATGAIATSGFGTATMTVKINQQTDYRLLGKIIMKDDEGKKKWSFAAIIDEETGAKINGVAIRTTEDGTTRNAIITCTYDGTVAAPTMTGIFQNITKAKIGQFILYLQ